MADNNYSAAVTKAKMALGEIRKEVTLLDNDLKRITETLQKYANNQIPSAVADQLKLQAQSIKDLEATVKSLNLALEEKKKKTKVLTEAEMKLRVEQNHANATMKDQVTSTKAVTDAMTKLNAELKVAKRNYQNAIEGGRLAGETQKQYNKRLLQTAVTFKSVQARANAAKKAVTNFSNTSLGGLVSSVKNLMSAFGVIGGVYMFASIVKSAFDLTKQLDSMRFSMRAVITDGQEFAQSQEFLRQIAQDYGADLLVVTNRFIKFRAATQQAGLTAKETQAIFGTMTKAAGVLGLKSDELKGVFLALEQMVSKGKITTEELRRQLGERLPGAMDIMANSMGVTTAELDKMLKKGEVITKDVLPGFAREVEKAYGLENVNRVETLQASTERLGNAWTILVEDFAKGNGVTKVLMGIFNSLANNLATVVTLTVQALKYFGIWRLSMIASSLATKLMNAQLLYNIRFQILYQREAFKSIVANKSLSASVVALGRAFLTSPIGIFMLALGALAAIFWDTGEEVGKTTQEIADNNKEVSKSAKTALDTADSVEKLAEEYQNLTDKAELLGGKSKLSAEEQKRLKAVIKEIGDTIPNAVTALNNYNEATEINIGTTNRFVEAQKELALGEAAHAIQTQSELLRQQEKDLIEVNKVRAGGWGVEMNGYKEVQMTAEGMFRVLKKGETEYITLKDEEHLGMLRFIAGKEAEIEASKRLIAANEDVQLALGMEANERQILEATKKAAADKDAYRLEQKEGEIDLVAQYTAEIDKQKGIMDDLTNKGTKLLKRDQERFDAAKAIYEEQKKLLEAIVPGKTKGANKEENEAERLLRAKIKGLKAESKAREEAAQSNLDIALTVDESIIDNDQRTQKERLNALYDFTIKTKESIDSRRLYEIEQSGFTRDLIIQSDKRSHEEKELAVQAHNERLVAIENQYTDEINATYIKRKKFFDDIIMSEAQKQKLVDAHKVEQVKQTYDEQEKVVIANFNLEKSRLDKMLAEKLITQADYDKTLAYLNEQRELQIQKIQRESAIEQLKTSIALREAEAAMETDPLKKQAMLDGIAQARMDLNRMVFENTQKNAEDELNEFKRVQDIKNAIITSSSKMISDAFGLDAAEVEKLFKKIEGSFSGSFEGIKLTTQDILATIQLVGSIAADVFDSIAQANIDNLDRQIEAKEEYYDKILESDLLSEEQRKAIEAEKEVEVGKLEEKKKKEQIKAAKTAKVFGAFNIAISTAMAVMAALAMPPIGLGPLLGLPLAIATGAMGAASIAMTLAKPIPKFEKGTMNAPGGYALVDEKVPEVHTDARGNIKSLGGSAPNLRYLERGDKIYKSHDDFFNYGAKDSMQRAIWNMNANNLNPELSDKYLAREIEKMVTALDKKKMSVRLNQKINISDDLKFLFNKNNTL